MSSVSACHEVMHMKALQSKTAKLEHNSSIIVMIPVVNIELGKYHTAGKFGNDLNLVFWLIVKFPN